MRRAIPLLMFFFVAGLSSGIRTSEASERNLTVILDSGHGGVDHGGSFVYNGKRVPEDAYMYDIALRIEELADANGWKTFFTVRPRTEVSISNSGKEIILPRRSDMVYNLPGRPVTVFAGFPEKPGVKLRLETVYGVLRLATVTNGETAWISLHFDSGPQGFSGAKIYTTPDLKNHPFVQYLSRAFTDAGLGPRRKGVRESPIDTSQKFIVLVEGTVRPRVLIEFGNFKDERDRMLLLSHKGRQKYAEIVASALKKFMQEDRTGGVTARSSQKQKQR